MGSEHFEAPNVLELSANEQKNEFTLSSLVPAPFRLSDNALINTFANLTCHNNRQNKLQLSPLKPITLLSPIALQWENALNVFRSTGNHHHE